MPSDSPKPIIIVLDDLRSRVVWLRKWFDGPTHIIWETSVTEFLAAVDANPGASLLILDHDLDMQHGSTGMSEGPDGLTGHDCTEMLAIAHRDIPILVWSRNGHGAEKMTKTLQKRGFRTVFTLMFGFYAQVHDLIKRTVGL